MKMISDKKKLFKNKFETWKFFSVNKILNEGAILLSQSLLKLLNLTSLNLNF
jgi:hypothetical protein